MIFFFLQFLDLKLCCACNPVPDHFVLMPLDEFYIHRISILENFIYRLGSMYHKRLSDTDMINTGGYIQSLPFS